jgi:hypothetical protein
MAEGVALSEGISHMRKAAVVDGITKVHDNGVRKKLEHSATAWSIYNLDKTSLHAL